MLKDPFPNLDTPAYDPNNLGISFPIDRPRGYLKTNRIHKKCTNLGEHSQMAYCSSLNAIRSLKNQPLTVQELKFKLSVDIKDGTLMTH